MSGLPGIHSNSSAPDSPLPAIAEKFERHLYSGAIFQIAVEVGILIDKARGWLEKIVGIADPYRIKNLGSDP